MIHHASSKRGPASVNQRHSFKEHMSGPSKHKPCLFDTNVLPLIKTHPASLTPMLPLIKSTTVSWLFESLKTLISLPRKLTFLYICLSESCPQQGDEASLLECKSNPWREHDCSAKEHAGVVCRDASAACLEEEWRCTSSGECISLDVLCDTIQVCRSRDSWTSIIYLLHHLIDVC